MLTMILIYRVTHYLPGVPDSYTCVLLKIAQKEYCNTTLPSIGPPILSFHMFSCSLTLSGGAAVGANADLYTVPGVLQTAAAGWHIVHMHRTEVGLQDLAGHHIDWGLM